MRAFPVIVTAPVPPPSAQRGAVLYIALIMLILLALIGLVGMRVAGMQERMAANHRAVNLAFQNAEGLVRNAECAIENIENRTSIGGCAAVTEADIERSCDTGFQARRWASQRTLGDGPAVAVRQIDQCIPAGGSLGAGGPVQANPFPVYQVTGYAVDVEGNPTSSAVVDTIFRL
ncbi:PilX N-terminal domain-containing pilus assembly protein [Luteimonas sp. FCS-9]|uniref:pilus assembly PilX family protein n=1 Tax=Luteimonas sp. FCS-9 TaxID=1547516 RepID=UPI00063E8DD9|nr:PilX N-terminal domain-containing pilus assembly protein [Luteimonas sp. FCS-9]KLJ01741.1 pilus assembly protein [Luteimonas sp. FCS-9]